jgi:spermidine dehydrogenase
MRRPRRVRKRIARPIRLGNRRTRDNGRLRGLHSRPVDGAGPRERDDRKGILDQDCLETLEIAPARGPVAAQRIERRQPIAEPAFMNRSTTTEYAAELGLDRRITRRDMLHGFGAAALAAAGGCERRVAPRADAASAPGSVQAVREFAPERDPDYYPPRRTGLRGTHAGAFEVAHAQSREGREWGEPRELDESYDLIVVGAGISGLAAAYEYRARAGTNARILILDNHDDFGGHAKRVEFEHDGHTLLAPGGSVFMETPFFSAESRALIRDIGVDLARLEPGQVRDLRLHAFDLPPSICFERGRYGTDRTVVGDFQPFARRDLDGGFALDRYVPQLPLAESAQHALVGFLRGTHDVFASWPAVRREAALRGMSYYTFLTTHCGLPAQAADIFTRHPAALTGVTADALPLYDAFMLVGLPGLHVLGAQGQTLQRTLDATPPITGHYAPEGNAILTRNLVKRLIPSVTAADTMEDLTTARFDYARLDDSAASVRIRLNSTVIGIESAADAVAVSYVRGDALQRVRARHCVYAGWHMYLPHLCPALPGPQKAALAANVKMPLVAVDVALRSGRPIIELGSASFYFPGRILHECFGHGRPLGAHRQELSVDAPMAIYMIGPMVDAHSGSTPAEQHRAGREKMLQMRFEDFEVEIREQLASVFRGTTFDVRRDIVGITVNRWPHGYSRQYNSLFDPEYPPGAAPHEIARARHGNVAIANSDAGYVALCNVAIDEALRAVRELLG